MRPDLQSIVAYWQAALRLRDWQIDVQYVPDLSHGGGPVYGLCSALADNRTAQILIRDPETPVAGDKRDPTRQVEGTVIHELLHLWFAPCETRTGPERAWEENAVWAIAEALHAHKGTEHEQSIARAMAARPFGRRAAPTTTRRQRMIDPILKAALQAAAGSEDPKAALEALLTNIDAGGETEPAPASSSGEAMPKRPMDGEPGGAQPPAARRAPAVALRAAVAVPGAVTHAALERILAERDERTKLMTANADRMSDEQQGFALELDLPKLRKYVAQLPTRQAPPGTSGDAGGAVQPSAKDAKATPAAAKVTPANAAGLDDLGDIDRRRMRSFESAADLTDDHVSRARKGLEDGTAGVLSLKRIREMKAEKTKKPAAA